MRDVSGVPAIGATFGAPTQGMSAEEGPRAPADHGVSSLGLFMSYGGGLFASLWACIGLLSAFSGTLRGMGWQFGLVALTGLVRSIWSMAAGSRLTVGEPEAGRAARRYAVVALVQSMFASLLCAFFLPKPIGVPVGGTLCLMLMSWPLALVGILGSGSVKRLFAEAQAAYAPLRARNLGIEGAGALMVLFGSIGVVLALVLGYLVLAASAPGWLVIFAGIATLSLLARAILHVRAGLLAFSVSRQSTGPGAGRVARFDAGVRQYAAAAYVSIGITFLFALVMAAKVTPQIFLVMILVGGPLIGWPVMVSRFSGHVRMAAAEAEAERAFGPAEDGGLGAVGFVLVGTSAVGLGSEIARWMIDMPGAGGGLASIGLGSDLVPSWMTAGALAIALVAGFGLCRMTRWARVAALAYGLAGLGTAAWNAFRLAEVLGAGPRLGMDGKVGMVIATSVLTLVLPGLTLALTLRSRAAQGWPGPSSTVGEPGNLRLP